MSALNAELERLRACADPKMLTYAGQGPFGTAVLRSTPEDFQVREHLGLEFKGAGEHLYLRVSKVGQNTRWIARRLAELSHLPYKAVSFAGMKDRHAVAEQWFSLHIPNRAQPDWVEEPQEEFTVLDSVWHDRKLRTGQLSYNFFQLRLRNCEVTDRPALEQRIVALATEGVPNYFGPQRFGHDQGNLFLAANPERSLQMSRADRALMLSALRSALFNGALNERIQAGFWLAGQTDDVLMSDRPRGVADDDKSLFTAERSAAGLMFGSLRNAAAGQLAQVEQDYLDSFPAVRAFLQAAGSQSSRRAYRARIAALKWSWQEDDLLLEFALGPGSYATMVVRELFEVTDAGRGGNTI